MGIVDRLKDRGAVIEAYPGKMKLLHAMWETSFLNHISKSQKNSIYLSDYLWHAFSYEKLNCHKREEAMEAFDRIKNMSAIFFTKETISHSYYGRPRILRLKILMKKMIFT